MIEDFLQNIGTGPGPVHDVTSGWIYDSVGMLHRLLKL